jgi:hypothetical protein
VEGNFYVLVSLIRLDGRHDNHDVTHSKYNSCLQGVFSLELTQSDICKVNTCKYV